MILDPYYDNAFSETLVEDNIAHEKAYEALAGNRLSASMLGEPTQWQVLKGYGFTRILDPYILGVFERGKDVEKQVIERLSRRMKITDMQKKAEYRGVIGFMDGMVDTSGSVFNKGVIPLEVKSVKNAKFARLVKEGKPQRGHALQGALYALSEGAEWFVVDYVSGEDYRHHAFVCQTSDYRGEIDQIIDKFNAAIVGGFIPVFDPPEAWMKNKMYNKFPEWADLTQEQCQEKLAEHLIALGVKI